MEKIIFQTYPHFYMRMDKFIKENESIKQCDICFLGDSLTEMFDVSDYDYNRVCINRGIVSDKSAGVLMTLDDRVIAINPKKVFLLIGSNDICDGYPILEITNNIKDIIYYLKSKLKKVDIVISTVLPPCYYKASHVDSIYPDCRDINRIKALNENIRKLEGVTIFDGFKLFADENDSLSLEDTLDGVHLTKSAYDKLKKSLRKIL